ncbi:MAG: radical SAM protein [Candidatus Omnitrophica bacterium]|nr:radical SAM protein [Candidatus Omnitrophota bacterium]
MNRKDQELYFPKHIGIEITNHCNIRCIICPHGHDLVKKKGYMNFEVFKKIIDDIYESPYKPDVVSLFGMGESLLHPEFFRMAGYGKSKGFYQRLTTNAFFITRPIADEIISSGAWDKIEISFDDSAEKYEEYKGGKIYKQILDNIDYFISKNERIPITISFIQYELTEPFQISDEIRARFDKKNVTLIACEVCSWAGRMDMGFLSEATQKKLLTKARKEPLKMKCGNGADMGAFAWDGFLRACFMDYNNEHVFGNVKNRNAVELLLCDGRKKFIDNIISGNHKKNSICKDCLAPYNTDDKKFLISSEGKSAASEGSYFGVQKVAGKIMDKGASS